MSTRVAFRATCQKASALLVVLLLVKAVAGQTARQPAAAFDDDIMPLPRMLLAELTSAAAPLAPGTYGGGAESAAIPESDLAPALNPTESDTPEAATDTAAADTPEQGQALDQDITPADTATTADQPENAQAAADSDAVPADQPPADQPPAEQPAQQSEQQAGAAAVDEAAAASEEEPESEDGDDDASITSIPVVDEGDMQMDKAGDATAADVRGRAAQLVQQDGAGAGEDAAHAAAPLSAPQSSSRWSGGQAAGVAVGLIVAGCIAGVAVVRYKRNAQARSRLAGYSSEVEMRGLI